MKRILLLFSLMFTFVSLSQNTICDDIQPFCTEQGLQFQNTTGVPTLSGPNYNNGCFGSIPNPTFFYMEIGESGPIHIQITQQSNSGYGSDVDFSMWGPFSSYQDGCAQVSNGSASPIQFSYSASSAESIGLGTQGGGALGSSCNGTTTPPVPQVGEVYIVMVNNYSGTAGAITFNQTNQNNSNSGSTNCSIMFDCPNVDIDNIIMCDNIFTYNIEDLFTINNTNDPIQEYNYYNGNTQLNNTTVSDSGTYTLELIIYETDGSSDTSYCTYDAHIGISVDNVSISANDYCYGDQSAINVIGSNGTFTISPTGPVIGSNNIISGGEPGVYEVIYTTNGDCPTSDTINIEVFEIPFIDIFIDTTYGCGSQTVTFTSNNEHCFWDFGDGTTSANCNISHNYGVGTFTVYYYTVDNNLCENDTTMIDIITIDSNPIAYFEVDPSTISIFGNEVHYNNLSLNSNEYHWNFGDGTSSNEFNPVHTYSVNNGGYTTTLVAINGYCKDTIQYTIDSDNGLIFYVPNTFIVGSNANPIFQPIFTSGYDPYTYTLEVYNRWGELLFVSHNTDIGWDGTFGNKIVKEGTYIWTIKIKESSVDKHNKYTGHVNVLR